MRAPAKVLLPPTTTWASNCVQKEDTGSCAVVPIPTVHSRTLSKVLEYCKKHVAEAEVTPDAEGDADTDTAADSSAADKSLEEWDKVRSYVPSGCTLCDHPQAPFRHAVGKHGVLFVCCLFTLFPGVKTC